MRLAHFRHSEDAVAAHRLVEQVHCMSDSRASDIVRSFLEHIDARDYERAAARLDDGATWSSRGLPTRDVSVGPAEVRARVFDRLEHEWHGFGARTAAVWDEPDGSATSIGRYVGEHRSTGISLDACFTHRWWTRGGKIIRFEQTVDSDAVLRARGETAPTLTAPRRWSLSQPEIASLGVEALQLGAASPGMAIVRVRAAGLNFADVMQAQGRYPGGPTPPYTPCFELAGVIEDIGPTDGLAIGDRVMAVAPGALAELVEVPIDRLRPIPAGWSAVDAASAFVQQATAHSCVTVLGRVRAGERVLITAAASSVGLAAITLARKAGATVVGLVSTEAKRARALAAGAHEVLLTIAMDWPTDLRGRYEDGFDVVLESVGGETYTECSKLVRPFGRLVVYGNASGRSGHSPSSEQLVFAPRTLMGFELGAALSTSAGRELLPAEIDRPSGPPVLWTFEDAPTALSQMEARRTVGKQVVIIGG